jgi:3',5'-cyclic AMP phosphodiesterase CpdA
MVVLAHLSDPHLGPLQIARFSELISKRAIGFLNWHRRRRSIHRAEVLAALVADLQAQKPDHVAVTGDLVNLSLEAEFAPARLWLDALGAPDHVTVIPGNHDAYVRATAEHSYRHWDEYMRGDMPGQPRFPFLRRRGKLALIALSSGVPTGYFMASGKLGRAQLAAAAEMLDAAARENLFRVVLVHHPPRSKPANYFKRLIDGPAFRRMIARHGAELILHGHDHVHSVQWVRAPRGAVPAVGVPSASATTDHDEDPAAYNLYTISGEPGAWRCEAVSRGTREDVAGVVELSRRVLVAQETSNGRPT